jgi:AcrR family transcriptional regulator
MPRATRRLLRRAELIEACRKVIARHGLSGMTLNAVAAEAGCSYGVIAFHFQTKDQLLLATLDATLHDYETLWPEPDAAGDAAAAARDLAAMIEADFHVRTASRDRIAVWAAFWAETPRIPAYRSRCNAVKRRYNATVTRLVAVLAAQGGLWLDAGLIAEGLNAMIDGWWIRSLVAGATGPAERRRGAAACYIYLAAFFPAAFAAARDGLANNVDAAA